MINNPPRTPNAGSSLVSRVIGTGVADVDSEGTVELEDCDTEEPELDCEDDRVGVTVLTKVVGRNVVTGTTVVPERLCEVEASEVVIVVVYGVVGTTAVDCA
jgi:hypothetical protein